MSVLRGMVHPVVGPIVPVILRQSLVVDEATAFEAHGYALVDTGAALSGIDEDIAIRLKLPPVDTLKMTRPGPSPDFTACRFHGEIAFPSNPRFPSVSQPLIGYHALDTRIESIRIVALLGRDWLSSCRLTLQGSRELEICRLP